MKRFVCILSSLLLLAVTLMPSMAADMPRLVDGAYILWEHEEARLTEKLDEISEKSGLDVVVVTVDSTEGKTPMEYADDFYDHNGYGNDGVLLLISMAERDWWISACGYGINVFTDAGIEYIGERITGDLGDGYYADAFDTFADLCDDFIRQAESGDPYDYHNLPEEPFDPLFTAVIALVAGFLIAFIATAVMKSQLKSVRYKAAASDYTKRGSLDITASRDFFLYRTVSRRAKPKENSGGSSTHRSSSGRSHGGGGGKF